MAFVLQKSRYAKRHEAGTGLRPPDERAMAETERVIERLGNNYKGKFSVVDRLDVSGNRVSVVSDCAPIREVVVSLPRDLDWDLKKPLNGQEAINSGNKPDRHIAVLQHERFIDELLRHGICVKLIRPDANCLEGVYTRDIAFGIGGRIIAANMVSEARWPEQDKIIGGIKPPAEAKIEGGNVIVDGNFVFVGVGDRTNMVAVEWLQNLLGTEREVVPMRLKRTTAKKKGVLHLDCCFLPIEQSNGAPGKALINRHDFVDARELALIDRIYGEVKQIDMTEVPMLGLNAPCIGDRIRMVSSHAPKTMETLRVWGYRIIPVNMSEIIKAEGAARCSTMPLVQE